MTDLELVDELVNHVPEPHIGQLHVDIGVQQQAKQVTVVVPGLAALAQVRGAPCIQVAEIKLLSIVKGVQGKKLAFTWGSCPG